MNREYAAASSIDEETGDAALVLLMAASQTETEHELPLLGFVAVDEIRQLFGTNPRPRTGAMTIVGFETGALQITVAGRPFLDLDAAVLGQPWVNELAERGGCWVVARSTDNGAVGARVEAC
jgi:hypothetical protein